MGDALIHVRVPAELKAIWVRESRAAGMRLTDWIIQAVEAHTMATIKIPADLDFFDLYLARDPVADDLIAEIHAEDAAGQHCSHKPGRA